MACVLMQLLLKHLHNQVVTVAQVCTVFACGLSWSHTFLGPHPGAHHGKQETICSTAEFRWGVGGKVFGNTMQKRKIAEALVRLSDA